MDKKIRWRHNLYNLVINHFGLLETTMTIIKSSSDLEVSKRSNLLSTINLHAEKLLKRSSWCNMMLVRAGNSNIRKITYAGGFVTCYVSQLFSNWNQFTRCGLRVFPYWVFTSGTYDGLYVHVLVIYMLYCLPMMFTVLNHD